MNTEVKTRYLFGYKAITFKAKEFIFKREERSQYYFQIISDKVKLNILIEYGKEFILNILGKNQSFGDPLLFIKKFYPTNAVSLQPIELIKMTKNNFIEILKATRIYLWNEYVFITKVILQ